MNGEKISLTNRPFKYSGPCTVDVYLNGIPDGEKIPDFSIELEDGDTKDTIAEKIMKAVTK